MRQCEVYVHDIKAGVLTEDENGYSFTNDSLLLQHAVRRRKQRDTSQVITYLTRR